MTIREAAETVVTDWEIRQWVEFTDKDDFIEFLLRHYDAYVAGGSMRLQEVPGFFYMAFEDMQRLLEGRAFE